MVLKVGKQAHWQASNPRDAVERMLGLLYSHVDPLNSLVWVCLCLLSEEQRIRTPYTCGTQLAGHSSGAPHCCQRAGPARFIIVSEFCISGLWGQSWCWRSEWQAVLPYGNSNWTFPYSWTDLNSGAVHGFLQDTTEDSKCIPSTFSYSCLIETVQVRVEYTE